MASALGEGEASSSTATGNSCKHQVFLSFRGEDTRKGFTDHLSASLERRGITAYRDDKNLEKGDVIQDELLKAIEESMFAVVVLSPNYASSSWCLDELHNILECSKNHGLSVVPVFYNVEPSDVRHQKGNFKKALRKHQNRFGQDSDKIRRWTDALTQIASFSGWDSKNQQEARLVENIVDHIQKKLLPKFPSCPENLVGILPKMEDVFSLLGMGSNNVHFVGIWGMGGIGKTTVARAVYEAIQSKFQVCCFMRDVREVSKAKGFVHLQKLLLSTLNVSDEFYDIEDGKKMIRNWLCKKKVLLVLDDISEEIQLENLAGKQDWFGPGSTVIITTRYMHLLEIHRVNGTYKVEGLVEEEALRLFCLKAFKRDKPEEGYLDLSKDIAKYTGGLPLALKVLGSYLCGRDLHFWHRTARELGSVLPSEILNTLKISFDHLEPTEKYIFLDIACFFKGMNRDEVVNILQMCDYYDGIENGIVTLIEKSLITLSKDEMLEMHDLLQDMGKNIVFQEFPTNPGKRSRLWSKMDIDQVLTNDMGTEAIQGIVLHSSYEARWSIEAFSKTSQLTFLSLHGMKLPLGLNYLPRSLKVLHWNYCPLKTLPLADQKYELVEIKLRNSKIEQVWHGKKFLEKLKYLDLSVSENLTGTPDISGAPMLQKLNLQFCSGLSEVHPSLTHHENLVQLDFSNCTSLKTIPGKLKMSSLEELDLSNCSSFVNLPEFAECMKLSLLSLKRTSIKNLPRSVSSSLPLLCSLDLSCCNLTKLAFPCNIFHLPLLTDLNLSRNKFVHVPISLHKLPKLKRLCLNNCPNLKSLPVLPSSIEKLEACNSFIAYHESGLFDRCESIFNFFRSSSSDRSQVFIMEFTSWVYTKEKVSPWQSFLSFNLEDGEHLSLPPQGDFAPNDRLGIILCFQTATYLNKTDLCVCNGRRWITKKNSGEKGNRVYFILLTNDYFSDESCPDYTFKLSVNNDLNHNMHKQAWSYGSNQCWGRWVHQQDFID
ncbi:hypothetical protein HN51_067012 [Arachis hypogaea]|uniref:TIR domain-containing protein n=2 Tax=Arachis hypogaea TaxID=3818 RepID=A0A444ZLH9_ARAHY|nr:TMV resistance protein N [Arachis hypogaea]QHO08407.1 TMV resistance protein N [Arachis hypogaea]RYR15041.1 hypothetical protein Ahy_B04g071772 [Arachis hypogaea]